MYNLTQMSFRPHVFTLYQHKPPTHLLLHSIIYRSPWGLSDKEFCLQCRRHRFNLWVRKIPWSNGNPLQNSCLKNSMDRGDWWATIYGAARVRHNLVTKPPQAVFTPVPECRQTQEHTCLGLNSASSSAASYSVFLWFIFKRIKIFFNTLDPSGARSVNRFQCLECCER